MTWPHPFKRRMCMMASDQPPIQSKSSIPFYRDERILKAIAQIVSTVLVIVFVIWGILNFTRAAEARNMTLSFGFLKEAAGFPISNPPIDYDPSMTFGRAFIVGLANTLLVSGVGIITATILGTLLALARLSSNWLLSRLALIYIEFHRNIPLLVLLFIWYFAVFAQLPQVADSVQWPGPIYINKRGLYLTWPRLTEFWNPICSCHWDWNRSGNYRLYYSAPPPGDYRSTNLFCPDKYWITDHFTVDWMEPLSRCTISAECSDP